MSLARSSKRGRRRGGGRQRQPHDEAWEEGAAAAGERSIAGVGSAAQQGAEEKGEQRVEDGDRSGALSVLVPWTPWVGASLSATVRQAEPLHQPFCPLNPWPPPACPLPLCHRLAEKIRIAKMNRDRSVQMQEKVQQQQQQKDYDDALHKYVDEVRMGMDDMGLQGAPGGAGGAAAAATNESSDDALHKYVIEDG